MPLRDQASWPKACRYARGRYRAGVEKYTPEVEPSLRSMWALTAGAAPCYYHESVGGLEPSLPACGGCCLRGRAVRTGRDVRAGCSKGPISLT